MTYNNETAVHRVCCISCQYWSHQCEQRVYRKRDTYAESTQEEIDVTRGMIKAHQSPLIDVPKIYLIEEKLWQCYHLRILEDN